MLLSCLFLLSMRLYLTNATRGKNSVDLLYSQNYRHVLARSYCGRKHSWTSLGLSIFTLNYIMHSGDDRGYVNKDYSKTPRKVRQYVVYQIRTNYQAIQIIEWRKTDETLLKDAGNIVSSFQYPFTRSLRFVLNWYAGRGCVFTIYSGSQIAKIFWIIIRLHCVRAYKIRAKQLFWAH